MTDTRRGLLEIAELTRRAAAYNARIRNSQNEGRVRRRRRTEILNREDAKLVHCDLCDTWLYTGRTDTLQQNIPAYRNSLPGHMRVRHGGELQARRAAAQAEWARGLRARSEVV